MGVRIASPPGSGKAPIGGPRSSAARFASDESAGLGDETLAKMLLGVAGAAGTSGSERMVWRGVRRESGERRRGAFLTAASCRLVFSSPSSATEGVGSVVALRPLPGDASWFCEDRSNGAIVCGERSRGVFFFWRFHRARN